MPNCLLDRRKVRPKPLRTQVELGPALTMRQCVNEIPSLVSFKRQATPRAGMQHRTRTPLTTIGIKVNTPCCIAKAKPDFSRPLSTERLSPSDISLVQAELRIASGSAFDSGEKGPEFKHVTTLRVNRLFHPAKPTQVPAEGDA
jgi:hypothetical protein